MDYRHLKETQGDIGRGNWKGVQGDTWNETRGRRHILVVIVLLKHGGWWQSIKHQSRVNLEGETFEGDTRRHYKETRGRRHADTLEGDMGRHWKTLKGDIGRRNTETLEEDTWRHWKETLEGDTWKH